MVLGTKLLVSFGRADGEEVICEVVGVDYFSELGDAVQAFFGELFEAGYNFVLCFDDVILRREFTFQGCDGLV